jgi:hypothetical protein
MSGTQLTLESFSDKVEKVEKALEGEGFLEKGQKSKMKGVLKRISSVPNCEICDSSLRRIKICVKVSIFLLGIAPFVFLFYKLSPFFSAIYGFFSGIYDFFVGAVEWVSDFLRMAYERILGAFDSITEYFLTILEFFEDVPDIIKGFFLLSFLI